MSIVGEPAPITLEVASGPPLRPVTIRAATARAPLTLGRSTTCRIVLADPDGAVSRIHAELSCIPGDPFPWRLRDRASRHGTFVNAERLNGEQPWPLRPGDLVRVGPWTFRIVIGELAGTRRVAATTDDRRFTGTLVKRLGDQPLESAAQRRLNILMQCAGEIPSARTQDDIAAVALRALVEGSGFPRCAILQIAEGDAVEILAQSGAEDARFSRSLLQAAADPHNGGQTVILNPGQIHTGHELGQSITMLDISAALCAPVMVDRIPLARADSGFAAAPTPAPVAAPEAFVYLDARGQVRGGEGISSETVAFCQAVARLCGLALSNIGRAEIEREAHRRQGELSAARDVQRIIMPPPSGRFICGGGMNLSYHVASIPGRLVAGDLFDVFAIDTARVGVLLGDVVGKGIAAGMVMANVQAHLSRLMRSERDPAPALNVVGRLIAEYSDRLAEEHGRVSLFVSLFAAVIDLREGTMRYSDAGHGYGLLRRPGAAPERPFMLGGAPLGVSPESEYESTTIAVEPGSRLILFSDGLIEQRDAGGKAFGLDRTLEALHSLRTPEVEVGELIESVRTHCGPETGFADDITVASLALE